MPSEDVLDIARHFLSSYRLPLTVPEAVLIDKVYTLEGWSEEHYAWLRAKVAFRERLAPCFLDGGVLEIDRMELEELLVLVPPYAPKGGEDPGLSLKKKLYRLLSGGSCEDENDTEDKASSPAPDQSVT